MGTICNNKEESLISVLGNEGVFDEFCNPFLFELEEALDKIEYLTETPIIDDIRKDILCYAKVNLLELSARIMIHELNLGERGYDAFCKRIEKDPQEIYLKYPVLYIRLKKVLCGIKKNVIEIYTALRDCRDEIAYTFDIDVSTLAGISFGGGDTHNGGRTVAVLTFEGGCRLVYKPRNMYPEKAFSRCCELLNNWLRDYELINPGLVVRENYGFQEFMKAHECKTEGEVHGYYHRIGRVMGLFYILDTTDIHAENIIPYGEYPIFIDLESLILAPRKREGEQKGSLAYNVNKKFEHSVFTSNLLPCVFKGSTIDFDISGLGAYAGQKSGKLKCLKLIDAGTDNIHYDEVYYETEDMENAVRLNGKNVDYSEYLADIEEGYEEAYEALMANKDYLIKILPELFRDGDYRQILKGTFVYARFMKAAIHPKYCVSRDKTRGLLELISPTKTYLAESEIDQMINNDVPYFYTKYDDRSLYAEKGVVENDFFDQSIVDKITANLKSLCDDDKKRQLDFIHNAVKIKTGDVMKNSSVSPDKIVRDEKADLLSEIVLAIKRNALWDENEKVCSFVDVNMGEQPYVEGMNYTLYDGTGLILFLFAYALHTQKIEDIKFAKAALAGMEELAPLEKVAVSSSVFGGFFGYIYLYYNLYRLTQDKRYYESYKRAIERVYNYNVEAETGFDVISGVTGAIIVLTNIYKYEEDERLKILIDKYTSFLIGKVSDQKGLWTGFSHGYAGFQYAFIKAFEVTKNMKYMKYAERMEQKEDSFFVDSENNWLDLRDDEKNCCTFWCHGAPGILLGRSYFMEKTLFINRHGKSLDNIIRHLNLNDRSIFNDSLCHGRVGNLDALYTIAMNTENEELLKKVKESFREEEEKIKQYGIVYGVPQIKGLLSFMLGLSGIGYGLLRQRMSGLPSVLSLEVV
ncbi:type 2 lanthipeptide synthetase LanM [Butyrivibrio sp. ob235]|uniref:type 2 lanthipeptide synthetase LanM n=1 Tax=Butyrivibrio sp. ob235 TaxID=1761780 RepID=UPI0015874EED|nr:type 2 lanthipeptide synthetase LanM [Butyrivibrio sp. ob235]